MASMNKRRVWIGAVGGAVVWTAWSLLLEFGILGQRYPGAQAANLLLAQPRYPFFLLLWIVTLFALSYVLAWLYANLRETQGAGPKTAIKLGLMVGFAAGFPLSFVLSAWSPLERFFPAWWCIELWLGSVISAFVAGWLYKEPAA